MINKILDGLFITNTIIVYILIVALGLQFFGFIQIDINVMLAIALIIICYLIEGILADRRKNKHKTL